MRLETFRGPDLARVFEAARQTLGEDVMIARTRVLRSGNSTTVEVVAAAAHEVEQLRRRLEPPAPSLPRAVGGRGRSGPFVIALVGPTGAGKTTTAAKLAVHPEAFGAHRVGLLTLDTFRVGALEQLQTYAEIASLPLEVVYTSADVPQALRRLSDCDVIVVDTPGRSPCHGKLNAQWAALLEHLSPDEVHLVLPANLRPDVATSLRDSFDRYCTTHMLLTKLDEVPGETGVAELAVQLGLPARWITDGQEVPADLRPAASRILTSLGLSPKAAAPEALIA